MEAKINELSEVATATITFATKQLRLSLNKDVNLIPQIEAICTSIESEVVVTERGISAGQSRLESKQESSDLQETTAHRTADSKQQLNEQQLDLICIIAGASLFLLGEVLGKLNASLYVVDAIFILSYLVLGCGILQTAAKNLIKGQLFDENFLMSIATLGAFAIQNFAEAVGVMLFYRIGEYFEEVAVSKSRSQIMAAVDLRPEVVNLVLNGIMNVIDAKDAKINDILLVRPGDRIPLDGILVSGETWLDTSPITGEPVPVKATVNDTVISGCINTSGQITMRVEKSLEESMVSRILDAVENAAANKPSIDRFITRFARIYTPFVVAVALLTAILPSLVTGDWKHWIYTALTFLVISCPCALVLSVPLAFFSGIGKGSKQGILFKGGVSIEALKNVTTVVMDKTGTITEGNFVVQKVVSQNNLSENDVLILSASCESNSTHPIGTSIVNAAKEKQLSLEKPNAMVEIAGHGIKAELSCGTVLVGNHRLMEKFHVAIDLDDNRKNESFGTEVLLAVNGKFSGSLLISDTIKADAVSSIRILKRFHIKTAMLTGDTYESANAIANAISNAMAPEAGIDEIHAKLLPEEKLIELSKIRKENGNVMFVGDGINDAPVLAGADVGAAMGSGADAAIEAADVVFMTSSMDAIPASIQIAKSTNRIAWQNVVFALAIKAFVMVLGLVGYASMWMAVFADSGVAMLCVLNSIRILYKKN
ncbi:cadmium-translocating P-type ATPase [Lachnospiraceae bacterium ZAX-1]